MARPSPHWSQLAPEGRSRVFRKADVGLGDLTLVVHRVDWIHRTDWPNGAGRISVIVHLLDTYRQYRMFVLLRNVLCLVVNKKDTS